MKVSPADQELAAEAVARGLLTREQADAALARVAAVRRGGVEVDLVRALAGMGVDATALAALAGIAETQVTLSDRQPPAQVPSPRATRGPSPLDEARARVVAACREVLGNDPQFDPLPELVLERTSELGRGGMGVVWQVRDRRLGREAALKLMLPGAGGDADQAARRFEREMRLTARLDHPSIPPVYGAGTTARGERFMLMKLIRGRPLSHVLRDEDFTGPFDEAARRRARAHLEALVKVGEAVAYAHGQGVIHRDLKPANVMIGQFGEVLVMDWGLAKDLAAGEADEALLARRAASIAAAEGLTDAGAALGTLGYMAPEQAGGRAVDPRADVWALGAMLVEVLTGRPPVEGTTPVNRLYATIEGKVTLPRSRRPDLPPELDSIARSALALDPAARTPAADVFVSDLRAYLAGDLVSAHRYGSFERMLRAARRRPALLVSALAALLLVVVVGLLGTWAIDASRRAEAEARVAQRRAAQRAAAEAFAALEGSTSSPGDVRLGLALDALSATQRWHDLEPRDPTAARSLHRAAVLLGQLALETEQWDLARKAFERACGLGVNDAAATALAASVEASRRREAQRRLDEVKGVLANLAAGAHDVPGGIEDAVYALARHPSAQVVAAIAEALDGVSALLEGGRTLDRSQRTLARAACEALGRLGLPDAEPALARYLDAEPDPVRAAPAGIALARLGTPSALDRVHDARRRFGPTGTFAEQVSRVLRRLSATEAGGSNVEPADGDAYLRRGEERLAAGDLQGALQDLGRAVELRPDAPEPYLARGVVHRQLGDLPRALADLDRALERGPNDPRLWNTRGTLRHESGDVQGAMQDWSRAIELAPAQPDHHENRGVARLRAGDLVGALEDLTRAVELGPRRPHALFHLGLVHLERGDEAAAERLFTRTLELDPEHDDALAARGGVRLQLGDGAAALEDCTAALALDPANWAALKNRAYVRAASDDFPGALEDVQRAVELAPRDASTRALLGSVRLAMEDHAGAITDLSRALELDPSPARGVLLNRGRARLATGDPAGASADFTRELELTPGFVPALLFRAKARHQLGELDGAAADLRRVVELVPGSAAAQEAEADLRALSGAGGR